MEILREFWNSANSVFWIGMLISFVIGYATNVLSGPHSNRFREWISGRHIRNLLRLGKDEVIVIVPHQSTTSDRRLPQVAVEDVLALRNVFELLAELGIRHPRIRHPENLSEPDLKRNIICIGGSFRNSFTKKILDQPVHGDILSFDRDANASDQIVFRRGPTMTYTSPSYSEPKTDQPKARMHDVAFILRRPNPKNETCSILVLAGIRGIGTWGASDHLRKNARKLLTRIEKDSAKAAERGFLAVIDVDYENFDIVQTRVKDVSSVNDDA